VTGVSDLTLAGWMSGTTSGLSTCANIFKGSHSELDYGPMPNVMVALPNIGGALCSTPQSLADAHY